MIKNIIFDVDEVLVNENMAKYNFIKDSCPHYANLEYKDLTTVLPVMPEFGGIGSPLSYGMDGYGASRHHWERPIFPGVIDTLKFFKAKRIKLFTLSSAFKPDEKRKFIEGLFGDYLDAIGVSPFGVSKERYLSEMLAKYGIQADETLFVDDLLPNIRDGIACGVHVVRMQPDFYLPLPEDLSHIPVVRNLPELKEYVMEVNT